MSRAQDLKDRWRGSGQAQARAAVKALVTGAPIGALGLDTVDGRTDLRGLWLGSSRGLPGIAGDELGTTPTALGVTWSDLDLSHATIRIDVTDAVLDNVRLDSVGWPDWRVTSSTVRRCSFTRANLNDTSFDGFNEGLQGGALRFRPSAYEDCTFTRTKIGPYGDFGRAHLTRCTFDSTAFPAQMWFRGAHLVDCRMTGRFRAVCFGWTGPYDETPPWLDVSVAGATFESLEVAAVSGPGVRET